MSMPAGISEMPAGILDTDPVILCMDRQKQEKRLTEVKAGGLTATESRGNRNEIIKRAGVNSPAERRQL